MAREFPGWLHIGVAAGRYRADYELLRRMVADGVFTRGRFTSAKEQAPIYLRVDELDAWQRGGVDAVRALREAPDPESVLAPDLGGEAGGA